MSQKHRLGEDETKMPDSSINRGGVTGVDVGIVLGSDHLHVPLLLPDRVMKGSE